MQYFVYRLRNNNDRYYIGVTNNTSRRVKEHRAGRGAVITRADPTAWKLVEVAGPFESRSAAQQFETKAQIHASKYSGNRAFAAATAALAKRAAAAARTVTVTTSTASSSRTTIDQANARASRAQRRAENNAQRSSPPERPGSQVSLVKQSSKKAKDFAEFKRLMTPFNKVRMDDKRIAIVYFTTRDTDGGKRFHKRGFDIFTLAASMVGATSFQSSIGSIEPDGNEYVSDSPNYADYDSIVGAVTLEIFTPRVDGGNYSNVGGAHLPWMLNTEHRLGKIPEFAELVRAWGLSTDINDEALKTPCFISALQDAGVDEIVIAMACSLYRTRRISRKAIKHLAESCDIHIAVHPATPMVINYEGKFITAKVDITKEDKDVTHFGNKNKPAIDLGIIDDHYIHIKEVRAKKFCDPQLPRSHGGMEQRIGLHTPALDIKWSPSSPHAWAGQIPCWGEVVDYKSKNPFTPPRANKRRGARSYLDNSLYPRLWEVTNLGSALQ
jgi:predicted GIY-YIG superfamily endonuclease